MELHDPENGERSRAGPWAFDRKELRGRILRITFFSERGLIGEITTVASPSGWGDITARKPEFRT